MTSGEGNDSDLIPFKMTQTSAPVGQINDEVETFVGEFPNEPSE